MFFVSFKVQTPPNCTPVVGNLNSEKYINILDDNLWPVIAQHFSTSPYIFQEDNAPCHVSRRTNQWKTENDIPTLEWPPQSPDLNIIENLWKVIKTKIQKQRKIIVFLTEINNKTYHKLLVFCDIASSS
jgi:hypothetical protein